MNKNTTTTTSKSKLATKSITSEIVDPFKRRGSVARSPPRSGKEEVRPQEIQRSEENTKACGNITQEDTTNDDKSRKAEQLQTTMVERTDTITIDETCRLKENTTLYEVRKERKALEEFLFNENNKISKSAIKFILAKWINLEGKLQEEILEKNKWIGTYQTLQAKPPQRSYAQIAAVPRSSPAASETEKKKIRQRYETIFIKPEKENEDVRTNEEIKLQLMEKLKEVKNKLKIRGIKEMRRKGIIIEVDNKEDVELLKNVNLKEKNLKMEEPKKICPAIIVYDVETDYKEEDLCNDLIIKNFDHLKEEEIKELKENLVIKYKIKTRENKYNWILQMSSKFIISLINKGKIYLQWKVHRVKEYKNIMRCYKCHAFGHVAKFCNSMDQLCELCGSKEHLRKECDKRNEPQCINCIRKRRKDTKHHVKSKLCPELIKQIELYDRRVEWEV